jgi:hypothetical protein
VSHCVQPWSFLIFPVTVKRCLFAVWTKCFLCYCCFGKGYILRRREVSVEEGSLTDFTREGSFFLFFLFLFSKILSKCLDSCPEKAGRHVCMGEGRQGGIEKWTHWIVLCWPLPSVYLKTPSTPVRNHSLPPSWVVHSCVPCPALAGEGLCSF